MDVQRWSVEEQVETRVRSLSSRLVAERVSHLVGLFFDVLATQPKGVSHFVFVAEAPKFDQGRFGKGAETEKLAMHRELQPLLDLAFADSAWSVNVHQPPTTSRGRRRRPRLGVCWGRGGTSCRHNFYAVVRAKRSV